MRKMYDAVTPANIPPDAQLVAGYLTGPYAWKASDWARFPNVPHVQIATQSTYNVGNCLDVETGDATPTGAVQWVKNRRAAGVDPTCYCNSSTWPSVRAAFQAAKVPEPHYWIAKYDQNPAIPAGAVAKQHTNTAGWDLSSVADYWPGVDPVNGAPEMELTDLVKLANWGPTAPANSNVLTVGDILAREEARTSNIEGWTNPSTGALAVQLKALSAQVAALQAATVAPVAVVDVAAIAKAVVDLIATRVAS
jgi:hypothetical protein